MHELPANRMGVMIVEDDQVTARDLEATLRRRGFLVFGPAGSHDEAIELARSQRPQLALLDIRLDNIDDGIRLASELKSEHGIPVIFVTGYSEETIFEQAREARPSGFLRKPFSDAELIVCLEAVLERDIAREMLGERLPGLEAVSESLREAVIASDLGGKVLYLNPAAEVLTGWTGQEAEGKSREEIAPITEGSSSEEAPEAEGEEPTRRFVTLTTREGDSRSVEERTAPIRSDSGEVVGLVTIFSSHGDDQSDSRDVEISEDFPPARAGALGKIARLSRDPAFRELIGDRGKGPDSDAGTGEAAEISKEAESVFSAAGSPLIDDLGDPLIRIDDQRRITYANAEAVSVFGSGKNLVGLNFWDRFSNDEFERYDEAFQRPLAEGCRHRFDFHDTTRGLWFEVRVYRTDDGVLALFNDTTTGKLEAAEGVRQQRLEGLGLLARGFAHDFNNHLTTITGNISLARERQQDDGELQQMLQEAQTASNQATGLVQQLMTFARGGRPIRKRTRISDLVRRIMTEHRLQHPDIRYQFQGAEGELVANIDPAQIGRLVENLVANSALAMTTGGVLIVRCARISPDEVMEVKQTHDPAEEDHLLIEVIDTGHGMSEESLGRVFEPYFTTRKEDNASGIGLTVCESIAKAHGGFIQLQSKEGKGTIATFCAPLGHHPDAAANAVDPSLEPSVPASPPRASLPVPSASAEDQGENLLVGTRILILEDDAPIRRLMAATLRRAGHEIVETKDGRETVAIYREAMEQDAKFHLIICDLTIENGMGGVETMRQLTEIDPSILAIVSSGYSDAPAMANPSSFGFSGVLPKPYAPSELRAAVHRILAAHHIIS